MTLSSSLGDSLFPRTFLEADAGDSGAGAAPADTAGATEDTGGDEGFGAGIDEAAAEIEASASSAQGDDNAGDTGFSDGAQPATPEAKPFSALEFARSQGVDYGYKSDEEFTRDAIQAFRLLNQHQDDFKLAQQIKPYLPQFQQFMAAQSQQAMAKPEPQTQAEKKRWIEKLESDPSLYRMVEEDPATGELKAKAGYDPGVVAKIMNSRTEMQKRAEQWITDPAGFLEPFQGETVDLAVEKAMAAFEEKYTQVQQRFQAQDIIARDQSWMYVRDPQGQTQWNPDYLRYVQILRDLDAVGIKDPQQSDQIAKRMLQNEMNHWRQFMPAPGQGGVPGQPQQPAPTPAQQAQSAKRKFLRNGRTPNVGTRATGMEADTQNLSLAEMSTRLLQQAQAN